MGLFGIMFLHKNIYNLPNFKAKYFCVFGSILILFSEFSECNSTESDTCDENAVCIKIGNDVNCECVSGYTGNGFNCSGKVCFREMLLFTQ